MPSDAEWLRDQAQANEDRKRDKRLEEALRRGEIPRYGGGGNGTIYRVIVGGLVTLAVAGLLGGLALYREMGEVKAMAIENARRLNQIEDYVYRQPRR